MTQLHFDPEMTIVVIGGKEIPVPPMVFAKTKRLWPILNKLTTLAFDQDTPREEIGRIHNARIDCLIAAFSLALEGTSNAMSPEEIENRLTYPEAQKLLEKHGELLRKTGILSGEGVAPAQAQSASQENGLAPDSTETSRRSSLN